LTKASTKWLCPVRAASALLREGSGQPPTTPLCAVDRVALSAKEIERVIKQAAAHVVGDGSRYGTHSLRSGGATAMFEAGCGDTTIKLQGRWSSDCFQRYVRMETTTMEKLSDMVTKGAKKRPSTEGSPSGGSLSSC
jgi:hypothetical protein